MPDAETAQPETTWEELDVDSLDLVELVKALEDRFDVQIADPDLKGIAAVGDAIALVERLQGATGLMEGIVVTGRGVVSPVGEGADAFFDALLNGRSGIAEGVGALHVVRSGVGDDRPRRRAARTASRQLAVAAAIRPPPRPTSRTASIPRRLAIIIGTGVGGLDDARAPSAEVWLEKGDRAVSPHFVPMMMPNAAAGTVAMRSARTAPASRSRRRARRARTPSARRRG